MDSSENPSAQTRERRFRALVDDLVATVTLHNPTLPTAAVRAWAGRMAELRILAEEMEASRRALQRTATR